MSNLKPIGIGILSLFFLVMGIDLLINAYNLKNPIEFLIYFFAANFMILISAVGCLYPFMKLYHKAK